MSWSAILWWANVWVTVSFLAFLGHPLWWPRLKRLCDTFVSDCEREGCDGIAHINAGHEWPYAGPFSTRLCETCYTRHTAVGDHPLAPRLAVDHKGAQCPACGHTKLWVDYAGLVEVYTCTRCMQSGPSGGSRELPASPYLPGDQSVALD